MASPKKVIEALESLKSELPLCFKSGKQKIPISIGIHHDVFKHYENDVRFSKTNLRDAIRFYTSGTVYLKKIVAGIMRININGKETMPVTQKEEENAKIKLQKNTNRKKKFLLEKEN